MKYNKEELTHVLRLLNPNGLVIVEGNPAFIGFEDILRQLDKEGYVKLKKYADNSIVSASLTDYGKKVIENGGFYD